MRSRRHATLVAVLFAVVVPAGACDDAASDDDSASTTTGAGAGGARSGSSAVTAITTAASSGTGPGATTSGTGGAAPVGCVRPDASNTGVPPGTVLEPRSGNMTITEDGAIIEGIDLEGWIAVEADDVIIRKSRIRRGITVGHYPDYAADDLLVEDTEIGTDEGHAGDQGVQDRNFTLRRVNIHNFHGGARATTNATIEHSYFHHPFADIDSGHGGSGFFSWWPVGPGGLRFYCNTMDVSVPAEGGPPGLGNNAFEVLGNDGGAEPADLVLEENWFNGGTYSVYILDHWKSVTVKKNRWKRDAEYGPLHYDATLSGPLVWEDNAFEDGESIDP